MKKKLIKIFKVLKRKKMKVSVAESCTGGMLAKTLTSISGSSQIFNFGLVTYSNNSKNFLLNVSKKNN